ncbi:MAG: leucyl aminopeptidase [Acidobacteria bacterium]|nr:leucyl aminopeptidase [Acidobacteriota bacterium]
MKFQGISGSFAEANADAFAIPVFRGDKASDKDLKALDKLSGGQITDILTSEEMKGDAGEISTVRFRGKKGACKLLLIGAGERKEYDAPAAARFAGTAARAVGKGKVKSLALSLRLSGAIANAVQGVVTSQFELHKYRTKDKSEPKLSTVMIAAEGQKPADVKSAIARGVAIGESMNFTRDLANEPPNILTPTEMARRAQAMAAEVGLKCEVLDEAKMTKLGMGSLMSVSIGSEQPAKLITLRYTPAKSTAKDGELLALVGKGITFDTGGISLKPGDGMDAMKYDMSGGATVIGTMRAIALLKPSVPVIGVVAAVENMPDGKASRPSDVVTAMNGKTIEILNTDAEGRLILADAVAWAEKQGATRIVDMATLTGAVIIALGGENTGIMGNDQALVDEIISCGKKEGEGFWQLPVGKEYSKMIKSDIADIKNIGPRGKAGTIMGAVFIQEFIDNAKWAHLDIAGTAWNDSVRPFQAKGPTGVAIRSLIELVERSQ